jgi:ketosteroid isomerase-like protein
MTRWLCAALLAAVAGGLAAGADDRLSSLVDAERAFARLSVATSQREAFLANFAEDGVLFTPAPGGARAVLSAQPQKPSSRVLDWEPETGDVAASGDLGYTTGPYMQSERGTGARLATGRFFTVWRWEDGKGWKVAADVGIEAPLPGDLRGRPFARAAVRAVAPQGAEDRSASGSALRLAETAMAGEAARVGWAVAYRKLGTADILVYRDGRPLSGDGATASLPSAAAPLVWQPLHAEVSAAGDLGFTYGAYTAGLAGQEQKGYYLHVWKRGAPGWRLAADVANVAVH